MTGTYGAGKCQFPCSVCVVPQDKQNNLDRKHARRNKKGMELIITDIRSGSKTDKDYSAFPVEVRE